MILKNYKNEITGFIMISDVAAFNVKDSKLELLFKNGSVFNFTPEDKDTLVELANMLARLLEHEEDAHRVKTAVIAAIANRK